eukprot:scaffold848_cov247-Pinguiococcus_pyrenoidosus.AAC.9
MSETDFGSVIRESFSKLQSEVDRLGKQQQVGFPENPALSDARSHANLGCSKELQEIASERLSGGDLSAFVPPKVRCGVAASFAMTRARRSARSGSFCGVVSVTFL